jgi:hypothetical protein
MVTVTEKGRKNLLITPPSVPIGKKTATVVKVLDTTGAQTSVVPLRAASVGLSPRCRCRYEFSRTTIASSTIRPIAIVRPASVSTLSE